MKLGLEPFILQNSGAGGKALIETLETKIMGETASGIVLMTPNDFGYGKTQTEADRQKRARRNLILEMGMPMMAALRRDKMLILKKGAAEMPSDTVGIQYHEFNDHVKEIAAKLVQRPQQLGFTISADKMAKAAS